MKNNNLRIIQINGFRGLFISLFIISCLVAGFIAFPSFLTMNMWNYIAVKSGSFPLINFNQAVLLWAIIAFSAFVFSKRKFIISFCAEQELSENEVQKVVSKIKEMNNGTCINNLSPETKEKEEAKSELK